MRNHTAVVFEVSIREGCLLRQNSSPVLHVLTTSTQQVYSAHKDWHALVRRVSGLILVAWRQYLCPLIGTVLIEFRNGLSDERLTAIQMHMKDVNVHNMLGCLKDLMVRMNFWSGRQCIANAYDLCIYHPWIWPSKCDLEVGRDSMTPCTNTNSEKQTSSTGQGSIEEVLSENTSSLMLIIQAMW